MGLSPYSQLIGLFSLQAGLVSLVSSSEGPKLCLKDEAEVVLYLSAGCLGSHFSAFVANSHSSLAVSSSKQLGTKGIV